MNIFIYFSAFLKSLGFRIVKSYLNKNKMLCIIADVSETWEPTLYLGRHW